MTKRIVYLQDGSRWEWHYKADEDEHGQYFKYWTTNRNGDGIFRVDSRKNERTQLVGTWDFSLVGIADPRRKIRAWMSAE